MVLVSFIVHCSYFSFVELIAWKKMQAFSKDLSHLCSQQILIKVFLKLFH